MKTITLADLAAKLGGELDGDPDFTVTGVAPLHAAGPQDVSFVSNPRYISSLKTTSAGAVIVGEDTSQPDLNLIRVRDPYLGFAAAMEFFYKESYASTGISERAVVHNEAIIGDDPSIHPMAVVESGAVIGSRVAIMHGTYVGPGVVIGDDTVIHPNVVLEKDVQVGRNVIIHAGTVVGSDGFGFAPDAEGYQKIVHAGTVRIEDNVEIGAGCTIDRAVLGETVIGQGSKLDNLIQIAHNVKIGANCILVAQAGIAGSAELGDHITMAGQSGILGHLKVGSGAVMMVRALAFKDVPPGAVLAGTPAIDAKDWKRAAAVFNRLDDLRKRLARLEKKFSVLIGDTREEETP